jgi:hypothetical protein
MSSFFVIGPFLSSWRRINGHLPLRRGEFAEKNANASRFSRYLLVFLNQIAFQDQINEEITRRSVFERYTLLGKMPGEMGLLDCSFPLYNAALYYVWTLPGRTRLSSAAG